MKRNLFPKANGYVPAKKVVDTTKAATPVKRNRYRQNAPKDLQGLLKAYQHAAGVLGGVCLRDGNEDGEKFCKELIKNTDAYITD